MTPTGLPENTSIVVRSDFRYYPVILCEQHRDGYVLVAKYDTHRTASFRTERGARALLWRYFGERAQCPAHRKGE